MENKIIILCWRRMGRVQCVMYKEDLKKLEEYIGDYFQYKEVNVLDNSCWSVYEDTKLYTFCGDEHLYHENSTDGYSYDIYLNKESHSIVIDADNVEWQLYYSFRMIRNLLRWIIYDDSMVCLHGGAITYKNKGILFLGNKKSGKTSTILSMLINMNANFVTNDDVMIQQSDEPISLGWPRAVSIRKDTIQILGLTGLNDSDSSRHPNNVFLAENCINSENKYLLPKEFTSFGLGNIISETTTQFVIFPNFIRESDMARIEKLKKSELIQKLHENLIIYPEKYCMFLKDVFKIPSMEQIEKNLMKFSEKVEGYNLYQKFNELDKGSKLIDSILD